MIVTLSGSVLNFLMFTILILIYLITKNKFLILLAIQSFAIGTINILPIESLDGGEALKLILSRFLSYDEGKKIIDVISLIFLVSVAFIGVFLVIKSGRNISIILLVLYLIFEKYFI